MGQVAASIVQLAMPSFEDAFDAPFDAVCWPRRRPASILAAARNRRAQDALSFGFALFGLSSALCGLAPNLPLLIAFRLLQRIGGSMLGANSVVILVAAAGPARRGKALGIMAVAQAVGSASAQRWAVFCSRRWAGARSSGSRSRSPSWARP
jgi:MFS family permease